MGATNSTIHCSSCKKSWNLPKAHSVYEKQRQESCPCHHCGAYTLSHRETLTKIQLQSDSLKPLANAS